MKLVQQKFSSATISWKIFTKNSHSGKTRKSVVLVLQQQKKDHDGNQNHQMEDNQIFTDEDHRFYPIFYPIDKNGDFLTKKKQTKN